MARPTPSLTLALMQARESAMDFFRPHLNRHNITEQQWRVIRILWQSEDQTLESHRLAKLACILPPSLTGVLVRLEQNGLVERWKPATDQRRLCVTLTGKGNALFEEMKVEMISQYKKIQRALGEEKYRTLMSLLKEVQELNPDQLPSDPDT
ncbi:homoprotocatechuate degradation operon regulator HpaR [Halomonas sp. FeN2]|jgi:homoprotocatechuate degradation regulator HpaR|uniref:Homoprotocatechuate degradation operon regulator HpaR n=1 Tax=Vreelandella neptunia TaxID=115551 RepID=A0ABZ0YK77_9GAMM|nr:MULTISPECIES: homoprotocatechuate degradation operon regulator HpaR [Halomonas]MBF56322.1 homoprotocatechuate degradation operon regulator HpaR [Halomonas sp.]MBL1266501.1 homoprotocatechuate degradation operon regulator HpaR [Halomonas sp.]MDN3562174.1 homoprotocatechuate degradation operon regulator HpaR [Halomonas neptunia]UBR51626.1 homoprotocatechuate degradation operon regulator HpaR [Halomonas sp. FeN2]WQH12293.1 homoprotocatechuate degradation operon regulator HpaR [Halomonas neptun